MIWLLANWRLVAGAALIIAILGIGWGLHHSGYKAGYAARDAEQVALDLAATTQALDTLTGRVKDAAANSAALADNLSTLGSAVDQAKKEIRNVVPRREDDVACNLPATARGLQNRASGYRD